MTAANADWFIAEYDRFVASQDDGAEVEQSRDAVARRYVFAVQNGRIDRHQDDLGDEGRELFDRWVGRTRSKRRDSFRKDIEWITAALNDDTILGPHDPVFKVSYPLGDGRDKVLGRWTIDDWRGAIHERNSNAVATAASAHEFQVLAGAVVQRMQARSAATTAALFTSTEDAA